MAEMEDLNNSFKRLESDVQLVKTVIANTERQCWGNAQHSRRESVKVIGIPKTVESKDLECTVCKVFNSIGFDIGIMENVPYMSIRDYGMNVRNFGIMKKFIRTLLSMEQLGSNRLKMVHSYKSITHVSDLRALFPEEQFSFLICVHLVFFF